MSMIQDSTVAWHGKGEYLSNSAPDLRLARTFGAGGGVHHGGVHHGGARTEAFGTKLQYIRQNWGSKNANDGLEVYHNNQQSSTILRDS